ncbi:MAG: DUF2147 domain-containing protein [Flavobacteriaceae bacterium]|nr:DUF2147 domain-containing protein [Flavobacteriaceae bacterium]
MKKVILVLCFVFFLIGISKAQSVFGKWKTLNSETGKTESIVEIYKKDGKAYAKIIEITNENYKNDLCTACQGKNKNEPILGMVILNGLKLDGKEWSGGKILDPNNGKYYKCYIILQNNNKLKIRGYVGISLLGRTEYWYRVNK